MMSTTSKRRDEEAVKLHSRNGESDRIGTSTLSLYASTQIEVFHSRRQVPPPEELDNE